ncbi:MAG: family transporter [Solirubrobacterales bacterium]|jgi:predicted PurR-regulated permease PerM|nr:family transporter [Solirubrobacterales bacterium]
MSDHLADTSADQRPPRPRKVVVPRWIQLVALPLLVLGVYELAKASGPVLLIFIIAGITALILQPLVGLVQRARVPRGLAIAMVYLGFFAALAAGGVLLANPVSKQVTAFRDDIPTIVDSANSRLADVQHYFDRKGIKIQIKKPGKTALQTLSTNVTKGTNRIVTFGTDLLQTLVTAGFALILIFVLSIYMLVYGEQIGALARRVLPPGDGTPDDDYPTRVTRAVAGYVRGQLLFSFAMGTGAGVGLYIYGLVGIFPEGKTYALAFAVFFGLMELIPYVGPFLGALPPIIVALFSDPLTAVWVALLFIGLQQVEGHVVAPVIFGHSLRINPLFVIFALLLGGEVYGIIGALIALPILAIVRETVTYLREHLVLEPWGSTDPVALVTGGRPCPACGEPVTTGDRHCRSCGASLARAEVASRR